MNNASPTKPDPNKSELFIGLVGPCGTDLKTVYAYINSYLDRLGYKANYIKLSGLISELKGNELVAPSGISEFKRIENLMDAGDALREKMKDGSAVAKLALDKISSLRKSISSDPNTPAFGHAFVLDSLKHPGEIEFLRNIYGQSFWVISVYDPIEDRINDLVKKNYKATRKIALLSSSKEADAMKIEAKRLIDKDKGHSQKKYGQNVGKAFHLADLFISKQNEELTGYSIEQQIDRFLGILFGAPFITPTKDEYGAFYAQSAALRSADLSRQVGAVIATTNGELISSGCNEVPIAGGGAYWEGDTDQEKKDYRDFKKGVDANALMKNENVKEIFEALKETTWTTDEFKSAEMRDLLFDALYRETPPAILKEAGIANIIEFGRIVHAEMSAITDAARRGLALAGTTLYCTTFPCHMCARHILASGIKRVVYIEPYPKSHAGLQYKESIKIDDDPTSDTTAIQFDAFMGIAPRVFMPLFTKVKRKTDEGFAVPEETRQAYPKIRNLYPDSYLDGEAIVIEDLSKRGIIETRVSRGEAHGKG